MKKFAFLISCLMCFGQLFAQETMITVAGDILTVYDVEIGSNSVYYKLKPTDISSLKLKKEDVIMIKYRDGHIDRIDTENKPTKNDETPQLKTSLFDGKPSPNNESLISAFNESDVIYKGDDIKKKAKTLICMFGLKEGSILETSELKANIKMKQQLLRTEIPHDIIKESAVCELNQFPFDYDKKFYCMEISLTNKTNHTIYVDLANSYLVINGFATPYYIPSSKSTSSSTTSGGAFNLGGIAGALGVGGAIGAIAGGVTLGGASTVGTSSTTYSQRIISIPPLSSLSLEPKSIGQGNTFTETYHEIMKAYVPYLLENGLVTENKDSYILSFKDMKRGEFVTIPNLPNINPLSAFITYSSDENMTDTHSMRMDFYLRKVLGCDNNLSRVNFKLIDMSRCQFFFYLYLSNFRDYIPKGN